MICDQRMSPFMESNNAFLALAHDDRSQCSQLHTCQRIFKAIMSKMLKVLPCCAQCRLIDKIRQICPTHSGGQTSQALKADFFMQGRATCMYCQDCLTTCTIRERDGNLTIKATWTQQSLIKNVNPICSCHDHDSLTRLCKKIAHSTGSNTHEHLNKFR